MLLTPSFWEKHKDNIYIFGHIYATLYGLVVINYIPKISTKSLKHYVAVIYSHILSFFIIVILPIYFAYNLNNLVETKDRRWQLQLLVNFSNTLIKYCTIIVTYIANFVHYKAIRCVTKRRQRLEDEFNECYSGAEMPRKRFEFMLLFKFGLINAMMAVQIAQILYQYYMGAHPVRVYFQIYTFILWNYTENMADYFYFINCSALKFIRQLQQQVQGILRENKLYYYFKLRGQRRGTLNHLCGLLSDRLEFLSLKYLDIYHLYEDSVKMHQFQMLGLILNTLISNLTNLFTLFNLLFKHSSMADKIPDIVLNFIFAIIFYIDTYIVTLISDRIIVEIKRTQGIMRQFSQLPMLDKRLDETSEKLSLLLLTYEGRFRICGLFYLDRHLTYLTAATGFSYFITLVQFDINWSNLK
ncbi:gustatory receptor 10a [Lucilia cuprina]|uniref:gustatory receptor 10a n=1 Tax=Lucilia cuprina TaxID=7375 RepID=UPI001F066B42|nr:gustatory receptor 10a [Lucilia cuprina]